MPANKQKYLSQNFLARPRLATALVNMSTIGQHDIVCEIGPGKGILTKELAERAKKVIAIEKDRDLYSYLTKKFAANTRIVLYHGDFLKFRIRESDYKIFANIPFHITSAIIRKITRAEHAPKESYLIMQKQAAEKLAGIGKTSRSSVLARARFRIKIIRSFKRTDFVPVPQKDIVMLYVEKRIFPLVDLKDMDTYKRFITRGFGAWKKNLKLSYKHVFTYPQWKRLAHDLGFPVQAAPSELSFDQWLGLFRFFIKKP
jgi:23S rRNA (adenine-N6)-dimethyltransferase